MGDLNYRYQVAFNTFVAAKVRYHRSSTMEEEMHNFDAYMVAQQELNKVKQELYNK